MMNKGPLSLLLLGLGVYLTHNVLWGAVGLLVAWAIVLFSYDIPSGALILNISATFQSKGSEATNSEAVLKPRWCVKTLRKLVWLAMPLGFVMMLTTLYPNMPRYYIERYLGERELGIFSALSYLMVAGNMIVSALGQSATPRLAKYYAAGENTSFRKLLLKLIGISLLPAIACVVISLAAGRELLSFLYQPEYAEYNDVFVWLMVAAGIVYIESFLSYGITAARYFQIQMPLFSLVVGATFLACIWLIPTKGLHGAAIALIVGAVVRTAGTLMVMMHALSKLKSHSMAKEV
jgi:O-antigen/teichoic acid export membrane protein